ncbi:MAG: 2Fe-2S iron-sulfur cluster binding domain-containing protein [Magnetococcales bacterium]|nr:2Fe-2S iron-sulfur cluster binding domain-containing protein [Magnetococcales bacterium]
MDSLETVKTVDIIYDDVSYCVPVDRTVLSALEEVGIHFIRSVGCRGGVCGACTILYRVGSDYTLKAALMCQEMVQDGMSILPLPFFPQRKQPHRLDLPESETPDYRVLNHYPEVNGCIMCGECTRLCPMGIDVMGYVGMVKRGDLRGASEESFTCVQCQACALRCPAQISQPNAAMMARRYHARYQAPQAEHLSKAIERIESKAFDAGFRRLRRLDEDELRALYQRREREPTDAHPGTWLPEDRSML